MIDDYEQKLVSACQNGDKSAYEGLVKTYSRRVFGICIGILGNKDDAEDISQQVLLKGFRDINQLKDGSRFGGWLSTIAKNLCVDFLRRQKSRPKGLCRWVQLKDSDVKDYKELEMALADLPQQYRLALMLYYFDGRSIKNIAETLDISVASAQTRLSRARKKLRKLLEAKGGV